MTRSSPGGALAGGPVIDGFEVTLVELPVRTVRSHGSGDVAGAVRNVVLKLKAGGLTGWGEASPWSVFTGTAEAAAAALEHYLCPMAMGQPADRVAALMREADRVLVGHAEAKAALEMALLDIAGRAAGCSAAGLLGGVVRETIPLSVSLADPDLDADLALAERLLADGVRIFKIKTGFMDHRAELRRLERLRGIMPEDARLRVDYNQGLQPHEAKPRLRDLDGFGFDFIEQPVARQHLDSMAALTRALATPILADESVFGPADAFEVARRRAADVVSIKIMKTGGILRGKEVAAICEAAGMACYGGDMFESGLAHAAGTHLAATTPNITLGCEFYHATYYLVEDLLAEPFPVRDGLVHLPGGPGLGVAVDEDRLKRHAVGCRAGRG